MLSPSTTIRNLNEFDTSPKLMSKRKKFQIKSVDFEQYEKYESLPVAYAKVKKEMPKA